MQNRKLKPWVKRVIIAIIIFICFLSWLQLFIMSKTYNTPVGEYTCKGGILKVCSGSNEVYKYIEAGGKSYAN